MSEQEGGGKLHIDTDWKEEAAREKKRLAEQERREREKTAGGAPEPPPTFIELLNLIAVQAAVALGGMQGPNGERIPPNPLAARHFIDLLEVLQKKTKGNLTDEESRVLDSILYELRMQFVQATTHPPHAAEPGQKAT